MEINKYLTKAQNFLFVYLAMNLIIGAVVTKELKYNGSSRERIEHYFSERVDNASNKIESLVMQGVAIASKPGRDLGYFLTGEL